MVCAWEELWMSVISLYRLRKNIQQAERTIFWNWMLCRPWPQSSRLQEFLYSIVCSWNFKRWKLYSTFLFYVYGGCTHKHFNRKIQRAVSQNSQFARNNMGWKWEMEGIGSSQMWNLSWYYILIWSNHCTLLSLGIVLAVFRRRRRSRNDRNYNLKEKV